jgi:hypothetical protein
MIPLLVEIPSTVTRLDPGPDCPNAVAAFAAVKFTVPPTLRVKDPNPNAAVPFPPVATFTVTSPPESVTAPNVSLEANPYPPDNWSVPKRKDNGTESGTRSPFH